MRRVRIPRILTGRAIEGSAPASADRGAMAWRMGRIRDFAVAHELASMGRVEEARAILAKYDTRGGVVIEIVPGVHGGREVK